ncbi:MAG: TIGR03936 family radical SAM-associated protein, partial [Bacillota bacterium]
MPRYRVQFSKEGPARFWSHLDLVRNFERALRRAGLPMLYSQGFNPRPRFSFAAPLPVGMAGEKEYLDLELEQNISPREIFFRLSRVFPPGVRIKEVQPVRDDAPSLMAALEKAGYTVEAELSGEISDAGLQECLRSFLALPVVE